MIRNSMNIDLPHKSEAGNFGRPLYWLIGVCLVLLISLWLLQAMIGLSFSFVYHFFLYLYISLPFVVLIKPSSFGYIFAVFLPLQLILLCLAFMHNPAWVATIKWTLGWKDLSVGIVLVVAFFKLKNKMLPKTNWERWIYLYIFVMLLMTLPMKFPLMTTLASFRFNVIPFLLLLAGFYSGLSQPGAKSFLNLFFLMALIVMLFGIFEVYSLKQDFFIKNLNIGAFKINVMETGQAGDVGSYLYAPGFLHKRRMVSTFLGATPLGHYLSFVLCLFLAGLHVNLWKDRPFFQLGFVVITAFSIYLTASRLAMAEALAGCLFFSIVSVRPKRTRYLVVGGMGLLGLLSLYGKEIFRVASLTMLIKDPSTLVHFRSILNTPVSLFGKGLGIMANVFVVRGARYDIWEGIYTRLIMETGLLGFILFLLAYFAIIRAAVRYKDIENQNEDIRLSQALNLGCAVYAIIAIPQTLITGDLFSTVSLGLFWYMLGIAFRLHPSNFKRLAS